MRKLNLLLLIFGIFFGQLIYAQTRITGKVINQKNAPVGGATVSVKNNANISTATAEDGTLTINEFQTCYKFCRPQANRNCCGICFFSYKTFAREAATLMKWL